MMIGHSDIFDEEELRAIANDDSGQSSSCSSVGGGADQTENNDMICAPAPTQKVDSIRQLQLTNKHDEQQATTAVKGKESDESSSDDGGFLESWLEVEKRTTSTTQKICVGDANKILSNGSKALKNLVSHDYVATNVKCSNINIERNDTTSKEEEGGYQHILLLGESALQWISSSAKKKKSEISNSNKCGIVGIKQNTDRQEAFSRTSTLRLTKTSCKKRSHSGKETSEATIEEVSANNDMMPSLERTVKRGRIIDSSATGMVDCLARFDTRRKCYVLEVVDLLVGNLEPSSNASVIHKNDDKMIMFDPLTSKKKAEKHLKSLKKRK